MTINSKHSIKRGYIAFIMSLFFFFILSLVYIYVSSYFSEISLLIPEHNNLSVVSDDNQSQFWKSWENVTITDDVDIKIRGKNSLKIYADYGRRGGLFEYKYETTQNWDDKELYAIYWYGQNTDHMFRIHILTPDWSNRSYFNFYDDFKGWRKIVLPLNRPHETVGIYDLHNIRRIIWALPNIEATGTWHIDRITVEEGMIWLTLFVNFKVFAELLIYISAIILALCGIILLQNFRNTKPSSETVKLNLKDFIFFICFGLISGILVWFALRDSGWLAYLASRMTFILTVIFSILGIYERGQE